MIDIDTIEARALKGSEVWALCVEVRKLREALAMILIHDPDQCTSQIARMALDD